MKTVTLQNIYENVGENLFVNTRDLERQQNTLIDVINGLSTLMGENNATIDDLRGIEEFLSSILARIG